MTCACFHFISVAHVPRTTIDSHRCCAKRSNARRCALDGWCVCALIYAKLCCACASVVVGFVCVCVHNTHGRLAGACAARVLTSTVAHVFRRLDYGLEEVFFACQRVRFCMLDSRRECACVRSSFPTQLESLVDARRQRQLLDALRDCPLASQSPSRIVTEWLLPARWAVRHAVLGSIPSLVRKNVAVFKVVLSL